MDMMYVYHIHLPSLSLIHPTSSKLAISCPLFFFFVIAYCGGSNENGDYSSYVDIPEVTTSKKTDTPSLKMHLLSTAPQLRERACQPFHSVLECWLTSSCMSNLSCWDHEYSNNVMFRSCCFHAVVPKLWILQSFCLVLPHSPELWRWEEKEYDRMYKL